MKDVTAATGFKDTLLRCEMKLDIIYGNEKEIQPGVETCCGEDGPGPGGCLEAGGSGFGFE